MTRTVTDTAILLGAMQSPFGSVAGQSLPGEYTQFLKRGSLKGRRIGMDTRYFTEDYGGEEDIVAVVMHALSVMESLGATIVETDTGDPFQWFDDEFTALLYEFKGDIAAYLAGLQKTSMRTLDDLIAFNIAHCPAEMRYFNQDVFELSNSTSGDLTDAEYVTARTQSVLLTRTGIDSAMQRDNLDAILAPSWSYSTSVSAVAGYPDLALPLGLTTRGRPAGLCLYAGFLDEPMLLALAYDLEQEIQPRIQPQFAGTVPPTPPDAGICAALPGTPHLFKGRAHIPYHIGTGKPFKR
jgi:amidase